MIVVTFIILTATSDRKLSKVKSFRKYQRKFSDDLYEENKNYCRAKLYKPNRVFFYRTSYSS